VLEAEMPDRDEHDTLRQIELNLAAADPEFAALLRTGQRRLPRPHRRTVVRRTLLALLVLLAYASLVLGLPSSALAVAALATGIWALGRWPIQHQGDQPR
jgi:hypothetical protein